MSPDCLKPYPTPASPTPGVCGKKALKVLSMTVDGAAMGERSATPLPPSQKGTYDE
jgi:hypothetical protein